MSQTRRRFSSSQKAEIVRRHLKGKEPVSKLAEELSVQPGQIHVWIEQLFSQAEKIYEKTPLDERRSDEMTRRKIEQLKSKIIEKNEVIAELLEANVREKKKALGNFEGSLGSARHAG